MTRQSDYFLPCFLVVFTALCFALVGVASYFFLQGPGGLAFIAPLPEPPASPAPTPSVVVSLAAPACPEHVCAVFDSNLPSSEVGLCPAPACIIDDLRPLCILGQCADDGTCANADDDFATPFQCDCACVK